MLLILSNKEYIMKCVYCNEIINKVSNEHIIQNALGGELQGNEICCDDCNKKISQLIDKPFTDHFKTILMFFPNLKKMNNQNSSITINAIGKTIDGEEFDVIVKNKKISSSPEFQSKYKNKDLSCFTSFKSELFKIKDQEIFFAGIRKIAFNYAIYNKLEFEKLKKWLLIETEIENSKRRLKNVIFRQPIIPYYPLNDFEEFIENQNTEMLHSLLLFTKDNKLWCYVNLFNTFKYYVLLSEEIALSKKINKSYCQLVQKINHDTSFVKYRKIKQKMILAEEFNVDINLDDEEFIKKIKTIISKKNRQIDYYKYINNLSTNIVELYHWIQKHGKEKLVVSICLQEKEVHICFENNAETLTENEVEHLFDRFYTADHMRTGQNTGLGLAIVKSLAEHMGQKINAAYENGQLKINLTINSDTPNR